MQEHSMNATAAQAVELANQYGADDATADISHIRSVKIEHRDGALETLEESTRSSLTIGIYCGGRYSTHTTSDLREDTLHKFIEQAVAMTGYLSEDPCRAITDPSLYEGRTDESLELLDPNYSTVDTNTRIELARSAESLASESAGDSLVSCTGWYQDDHVQSVKLHSNGFEGEREHTYFNLGASVTLDDPNGGRPSSWYSNTTRMHSALPAPAALADEAVRRAHQKIGRSMLPSGAYTVIIENRAMWRFIYSLHEVMNARSLQQRRSFFEGKHGEQVASSLLTMADDPFVHDGMGSRTYDGEGIAAKRRVMIEDGVLREFYVDSYYGCKLGMAPTTGGPSNTTFALGGHTLAGLITEVGDGILVTSFLGGNSNSVTGDFSLGIAGVAIENGELGEPVGGMNIAGNFSSLWHRLAAVGNDPWESSSIMAPSMLFTDVQCSGE